MLDEVPSCSYVVSCIYASVASSAVHLLVPLVAKLLGHGCGLVAASGQCLCSQLTVLHVGSSCVQPFSEDRPKKMVALQSPITANRPKLHFEPSYLGLSVK